MSELINPEKLRARITRRWVCGMAQEFINRDADCVSCDQTDPHEHWECGYRNEISLTDEEMEDLCPTKQSQPNPAGK